jgi:hypothetical protein
MVPNQSGRDWIRLMGFIAVQAIYIAPMVPAEESPARALPAIAPGTLIEPRLEGDIQPDRWNRVVLLAKPQIASGEVEKLSASIRKSVAMFTLSILATVREGTGALGQPRYVLEEVGVGYSVPIREKLTLVTSDTAARLGASLDFVARQMLSENEKQLTTIRSIVRTETLTIFDTPAIMLVGREHKEFTTRHLIWVDGNSGKIGLLVWLIAADASGRPEVAHTTVRLVPSGTKEERRIHVDGRSFFLGIPSKYAFALEELPPGRDFQWSATAKQYAAESAYDALQIKEFAAALNEMLKGS